ncbi:IS110 family transposase [Bradyrhizobium sp.]|uniref:IS110 family transposase n=1 Tax=Bradyrhizobium sp. TaxID=376 RepID=UPI001ED00B6B|nr:IS110 family transposase [Bradyrhizobium sp.]MBV9978746.1 IS110 family transposase [Bradyrhizobium sp.]
MIKLDRTDTPAAAEHATVYLAFELSKAKWKLGVLLPGSQKLSRYTIDGGDVAALAVRLADIHKKAAAAAGGRPVRLLSCYEAGLDGHWLHRWLTGQGVINHEIDPSSIEVNRRARRAKTDRIDLEKLMRAFLAHLRGEPRVCSIVHVPTSEDEDRKRRTRERDRLIEECTAHSNRIKGLLHGQGIRNVHPLDRAFLKSLAGLRTGDNRPLPERLKDEIAREHERLCLVARQLRELEAQSKAELRAARPGSPEARINQLMDLRSIGPVGGQTLVNEVFYRDFDNRRQVGSYFGLVGTPYDSGERSREQGISKAGNRCARQLAVELAWLWTVHQPDSALTRWFRERVRDVRGRIRRIAIVALARKLMVALWRYLKTGVVPTGAVLRSRL